MSKKISQEKLNELFDCIFTDHTTFYASAHWILKKNKEKVELLSLDQCDFIIQHLYDKGVGLKHYHEYFHKALLQRIEWWCKLPSDFEITDITHQASIDYTIKIIRLVQKHLLLNNYTIVKANPLKADADELFACSHILFNDAFFNELVADVKDDAKFMKDAKDYIAEWF